MTQSKYEVCVVGGAGHVGAPLSILLANRGAPTLIYDINQRTLDVLASGRMPFIDEGAEPLLKAALEKGTLGFTADITAIRDIPNVIVTIGTPVDEFHNPVLKVVQECIDAMLPHLVDGQTVILRSTVFPGVTDYVHRYLRASGKHVHVAFCPERVVQGKTIEELRTLPQIVSGATPEAEARGARLFERIAPKLVHMSTMEAEFAKLFSNAYRYIHFAISNQFYMMAEAAGVDYDRILNGVKEDYPRLKGLPGPGFAGGPCLFKDTLQLAAFTNNTFGLGYAAMQVNEGLPAFVLSQLRKRYTLPEMTVAILGMAFKAESDDSRSSLSYKLKKLLRYEAKAVLTSDPYVTTDKENVTLEHALQHADLFIIGAPHAAYEQLWTDKPVIDIWNYCQVTPPKHS